MKKEFESNSFMVFNGKKLEGVEVRDGSNKLIEKTNELYFWVDKRYANECAQLAILANKQLNLPKNVAKGNFEDLCDLEKIIGFLEDEVEEIKEELTDYEMSCFNPECECGGDDRRYYKIGNKINYQRAREEIGDVAACLVGLLAKLDKMEREEK